MRKLLIFIPLLQIFIVTSFIMPPQQDGSQVYIEIDTINTLISNGYLSIEATIYNNSSDTIILLKPKDQFNEIIDYFSIDLNQGNTDGCGVETFELSASSSPSYRFSNDFLKIAPKDFHYIYLKGRVYNQLIYCDDNRPIELQLTYQATRFNGENSIVIKQEYVESNRESLLKSVKLFSALYEGEIKSEVMKFTPFRD